MYILICNINVCLYLTWLNLGLPTYSSKLSTLTEIRVGVGVFFIALIPDFIVLSSAEWALLFMMISMLGFSSSDKTDLKLFKLFMVSNIFWLFNSNSEITISAWFPWFSMGVMTILSWSSTALNAIFLAIFSMCFSSERTPLSLQ